MFLKWTAAQVMVFNWITAYIKLTCYKEGRVVWKLVGANHTLPGELHYTPKRVHVPSRPHGSLQDHRPLSSFRIYGYSAG